MVNCNQISNKTIMKQVLHHSIVRDTGHGILTTTLCGRMDNYLRDGINIAINKKVTCKHCLNAEKTAWGKEIIKQAEDYKLKINYHENN